jgi:aspartate/methionine/tyrosine aminotransferase
VAENKLVMDLLTERFGATSANAFADPAVFVYNSFLGMPVAREAAAYFLARRFLFPRGASMTTTSTRTTTAALTPDEALRHVQPRHVAFGAGCAALINNVFFLLGTDGDCCLIPKPYYAAFENDMHLVAGVVPFGVSQADPNRGPTQTEWQAAYTAARRQGLCPKFILLTNPHNPLGVIYSPAVLQDAVTWARTHDMHILVDEIYALSTQSPHEFHSILRVLDNKLRDDVHLLWAISKDFGASGVRCGLLYTQNEVLLDGMGSISTFSGVSAPIQYIVAELLTDDAYVDEFLAISRLRLRQSYEVCIRKLEEMVLPYVPAQAGLFVYVDFSAVLPAKTFEYEAQLTDLLFRYARVVLTPGESQRDERPGMYRICYAWVEPSVLEIALERLSRFVVKLRRLNWNDLGDRAFANVLDA